MLLIVVLSLTTLLMFITHALFLEVQCWHSDKVSCWHLEYAVCVLALHSTAYLHVCTIAYLSF